MLMYYNLVCMYSTALYVVMHVYAHTKQFNECMLQDVLALTERRMLVVVYVYDYHQHQHQS
jgi:hypothetical protein